MNRLLAPWRTRHYGNPLGIALFLLPGLGIYTVLMLYPTVQSLLYSMQKWEGLRPTQEFVGLTYYARMLHDPVVLTALGNNLRAWFLYTFGQLSIALLLAFALSRKIRGVSLYRFLFYIPCVISGSTLAMMWMFLYTTDYGLNGLLQRLGLGFLARPWLSTPGVVQWACIVPEAWQWIGFFMVIFLAAISGIPEEQFEASQIDGANAWQQLLHITLPGIRVVFIAAAIAVIKDALNAYIYQFIMTEGGPVHMSETLMTYTLRQIWIDKNWGYGSALAVLHFVLAAVAARLIWLFRQRSEA